MIDKDALTITKIILDKCELTFDKKMGLERKIELAHALVEFTFDIYDNVCKKLSDYDSL